MTILWLSLKSNELEVGTVLATVLDEVVKMLSLKDKLEGIERNEIVKALKECDGVMARAARQLGISDRMMGYKIRKYGIIKKEVRYIYNDIGSQ